MEAQGGPATRQRGAQVGIEGVEREPGVTQGRQPSLDRQFLELVETKGGPQTDETMTARAPDEFVEQVDQVGRGQVGPPDHQVVTRCLFERRSGRADRVGIDDDGRHG